MKNVVKLLLPAVTMTVFTACSSAEPATSEAVAAADTSAMPALTTTTCLWPTGDTYTIDLAPHELPENKGDWEIDQFPVLVKTTVTNNLPKKIHSIENEDFCKLLTDAKWIISQTANCSTSVAAVRIWLGMDAGRTNIIPIYEPIALCHHSASGQFDTFDIKSATTPTYYTYSGNAFSTVSGTTSAGVYQQNIKLKRSTNAGFTPFDPGKDVRSLIYSFQEIGALIKDNQDNFVTVWNAVTKKSVTPGDSTHYHTLLLGPPQIGPNKRFLTSFNLKYANLAHLCPDNCVQVVYQRQ